MSEDGVSRRVFLRRTGGVVVSATAAGSLLAACGDSSGGTSTSGTNSGTGATEFKGSFGGVQYPTTTASLPTLVGHERGFFQEQGLELENVVVQSSLDIARALQQNQLDFANGGVLPVLNGFGAGLTASRLIGQAEAAQGLIFITKSDSDVKGLADLKGKKVGLIGNNKNVSYYLLEQGLAGTGVSMADLKFTYFTSLPASQAATLNGVVDCGLSNKPPGLEAVVSGQARMIFDAGHIALVSDGLWTSQTFAEENPDVCKRFVTAFAQSQQWIRQNVDGAVAIWAKATKLDPEVCKASLEGPMLAGYQIELTKDAFEQSKRVGVELDLVEPSLTFAQAVIPTFQEGLGQYVS